ncbi:caspase family protein [Kitasatospora terrestris]|uniref:Peptidase C14 caspase domain-containing protein n=1 Tax=Kitasatospora terrestris TaxID=258051 RepID=A0ABP9EKY8_9ACTN
MPGRRRALLVAVDTYLDDRLPALATPLRDAEALAEVLADPSLGAFEVEVLANPRSWEVAEHLEELLAGSGRQDDVLLHFGCHGLKDDGGGLYLAASNTRPQRLVSTGVDSAAVLRMMRAGRASSALLLLDCCFAGAFARGTLARSTDALDLGERVGEAISGGRGLAVLTASSATEWALEKDGTGRHGEPTASVFTSALVEGIRSGDADRDEDGLVSLGELYEYVAERVRAESPRQTPDRWEFGVRKSLYVARSPRRAITEGDLPADLTRLLAEADPRIREIGIGDLGALARSADLPVALAALRRLEELSGDDSRRVSTAADRELAHVRLELPATAVDLGLLRPGAVRPTAELTLGALPLAGLSRLRTEGPVRAWIDGDRLRVTAARVEPGPLDGRVTLDGPVGTATVAVTGWALPDPAGLLDRAFDLARTVHGNPLGELLTLTGLALVAEQCGERRRAARCLRPVPHLLRSLTDSTLRTAAGAGYAFALDRAGDRPGAARHARLIQDAQRGAVRNDADPEEESDPFRAVLAVGAAWVGARLGLPDGGSGQLDRVLALAGAVADGDEAGHAFVLTVAATLYAAAGLPHRAADLVRLAESRELDDEDQRIVRVAGAWAGTRGAPEGRLAELITTLAPAFDDLEAGEKGMGLAALGWLAGRTGEPEQGRPYLERALEAARAEGTGVGDRIMLGLLAGWAAAHLGLHDLATTAAGEVVDGDTLKGEDGPGRSLAHVLAALIAVMSGRVDLHRQWLARATADAEGLGDADRLALDSTALWVGGLAGEPDTAEFLRQAAGLLGRAPGGGRAQDDVELVARLAIVLASAWFGPSGGPPGTPSGGPSAELVAEMFEDVEEEIEELADEALQDVSLPGVALATAFAWAAVQAGDRERGLRLVGALRTAAERWAEAEPLASAALFGALAWICALGDGRPHRLLVDAVRILLPTECRGDRTDTLFRLLGELAVLLVPGGSGASGGPGTSGGSGTSGG